MRTRLRLPRIDADMLYLQQIIDDAESRSPMAITPTRADKFSFGLWTVGYNGTDPFGGPTRAAARRRARRREARRARRLRPHLPRRRPVPFGSDATPSARSRSTASRAPSPTTGLIVADGHHQPVQRTRSSRTAASPPTTAPCAASRCARCCATSTSAAELGAKTFVMWGGREGAEYDARQGHPLGARPLPRGRRTCSATTSTTRATTSGSPSSPSRTSPAATSCCRPSATRSRFIDSLERPELVGLNPEVGHEQMAGPQLHRRHRAGAVTTASCSTST